MNDDDVFSLDSDSDCDATATGIISCLRMLADEAASLKLARTITALRETIEICAAEVVRVDEMGADDMWRSAASGRLLH
jgi:hypothetical protein